MSKDEAGTSGQGIHALERARGDHWARGLALSAIAPRRRLAAHGVDHHETHHAKSQVVEHVHSKARAGGDAAQPMAQAQSSHRGRHRWKITLRR